MSDPYWFQKKWGTMKQDVPIEVLIKRIEELEEKVAKLEEENIESTNLIYELMNSLDAVDNRIDIVAGETQQIK
jgi:tetrahydromethanopterin S-methyltransferase subunit G